jgi:hypothetical protein
VTLASLLLDLLYTAALLAALTVGFAVLFVAALRENA